MTGEYHDRFSEATEELDKKNAFFCKTCKTSYGKDEEEEHKHGFHGTERTLAELLKESTGP